ncbi:hypothetical protein R50072_38940 [Simiduia litorea]|uniref:mitochondrial fission ELM1 family protein n=1 Tax=Simiduia litorea TaxID=1435348 RepID=UPI0036F3BDBC
MSKKPPIVWLLTDQKPGHLNQLRGLAQQLEAKVSAQSHVIDITSTALSFYSVWRGVNLAPRLPVPDMVIAAGSGTQRALLATKRCFAKPSVLLMRPNFPYAWLDAAIVPAHDNPPLRANILVTQGVLNAVQPSAERSEACAGAILIGGPSKHYGWDDAGLVAQVKTLCEESHHRTWVLSDSRRTPEHFLSLLADQNIVNLTCFSYRETEAQWLSETLALSSPVWVTPDSVSMVYEALTSGAATGLFALPGGRPGRVTQGLDKLVSANRLVSFANRQRISTVAAADGFCEAERAAAWLVERFLKDFMV